MTRFDGPPGRPLRREEIDQGLRSVMPQARSIETTHYQPQDGSFRAEVLLPSRANQGRIVIRRYGLEIGAPEDEPCKQRCSISSEIMWGWYIDYDACEISDEEVRILVARPLVQSHVLSYPREIEP